jgi:hypothetical protein
VEIALVAVATLAGASLQSATGFGFALLLGPAAFAAFEPGDAVFVLLLSGALLSFLVLFAERRPRQARPRDMRLILAASLPGMVGGIFILAALDKDPLQVLVGLGVLAAAALQARAAQSAAPAHPAALRAGTGLVTGLLTTTTSTNGPPLVLLFQRLGYSPAEMRDSLAAAFLFLDLVGGVIFAPFLINGEGISATALAAIAVCTVAGQELGRRIFVRLDQRTFRTAGLLLVTLAGLASIAAGLAG